MAKFWGAGEVFGAFFLFRIEEEVEMSGANNSVETVNAAAAAIVSAESRVQQVTVPVGYHLFLHFVLAIYVLDMAVSVTF